MPNLLIKFNKFGITFCERFLLLAFSDSLFYSVCKELVLIRALRNREFRCSIVARGAVEVFGVCRVSRAFGIV